MSPAEILAWAEKVRRAVEVDQDDFRRALETHSWRYGTFDVTCIMCKVSKSSLEATKPCPVVVFGESFRRDNRHPDDMHA